MRQRALNLLIIFSLISFFSCKKNNVDSPPVNGNWELRQISAGLSGSITTFPPGTGSVWEFTDSNYEWYENGQLFRSGTYSLVSDTSMQGTAYKLVLNYQSNANEYYLKFGTDQLILSDYGLADGYDYLYQRIQ